MTGLPEIARHANVVPDTRRLDGKHRGTMHLVTEQSRDGQGVVPNQLGRQPPSCRTGVPPVPRVRSSQPAIRIGSTTVGGRCHQQAVQRLHTPSTSDPLCGQPVKQPGVSRPRPPGAKVLDCLDQPSPEQLRPVPVDHHACRQRIAAVDQPSGQIEPVERAIGGDRNGWPGSRRPGSNSFPGGQKFTSLEDPSLTRPGHFQHHQRRRRFQESLDIPGTFQQLSQPSPVCRQTTVVVANPLGLLSLAFRADHPESPLQPGGGPLSIPHQSLPFGLFPIEQRRQLAPLRLQPADSP